MFVDHVATVMTKRLVCVRFVISVDPVRGSTVTGMARKPEGRWFGIPYNWRFPKRGEALKGPWDPSDHRIITPKHYGWGYDVNLAEVKRRLSRRRGA
jgi:hypothetical protein